MAGCATHATSASRPAERVRRGEEGGIGDVICEDCGETNKPGTEFCVFCGAYLGWQEEQNPSGAADVTQPLAAQPVAPAGTSRPSGPGPAASSPAPPHQPTRANPAAAAAQPATRATASPQPGPVQPSAQPSARSSARAAGPIQAGPIQAGPIQAGGVQAGGVQAGGVQAGPIQAGHIQAGGVQGAPTAQYAATAVAPGVPPADLRSPAAPAAPAVATCPTCGRTVDDGRRFCGHCGTQFIGPGAGAPVTRPTTKRDTWWTRLWDSKDRTARRAYRRSLPPLYRWRRAIIAVLALGLIGGGLTLIGRSPKAFVLARYYDLKGTLVPVEPVTPGIIPPEASAAGTTPQALVDGSAKAWQMNWSDTTQGSPCEVTPTTPVIELSFARARIRQIDLRAGLLAKNPNRLMQFRPQNIWIAYADKCQPFSLLDVERQPVPLDTKVPVDSLRIGVRTAFGPAQPEGAQQVLGFTEITLQARPPVR